VRPDSDLLLSARVVTPPSANTKLRHYDHTCCCFFADELAKITDRDKRIAFIYSKMCEVRRLYNEQRTELQDLDRRRKKRTTKMAAAAAAAAAGSVTSAATAAGGMGRAAAAGYATPSTKVDQGV